MNNMTYVGIGVLVVIIVIGVLLFTGSSSAPQTTAATTAAATTAAPQTTVTVVVNNTYNTTTTTVSSNTMMEGGPGCNAATDFKCTSATYASANGASQIVLTINQSTGTSWSSFGVAYAPAGTKISQNTPQNVTFYLENASNGVGASLNENTPATITVPVKGAGNSVNGAIWVCYINSGILYVANGCTTSRGTPATYVEVATVNLTS